jgi:hypothetical protein
MLHNVVGLIKKKCFSVPYREISYDYRGFEQCDPDVKARCEEYFTQFLDGYHVAVQADSLEALGTCLNRTFSPEFIGFAYEAAGMYLALLDFLTPWNSQRLDRFIAGPAERHDFITLIGIGFAIARLPWLRLNIDATLRRLDPTVGWFAVDGYGFHEGFFHHERCINQRLLPKGVSGYAAKCFDNGLGRSIWFVMGADPERIQRAILAFPEQRRPDLWAGIGLACTFAGGVHQSLTTYERVIDKLKDVVQPHYREFGLGVIFAAYTRYRADTISPWTDLACNSVLGISAEEAGRIGARALEHTKTDLADASVEEMRMKGYERARQEIMQIVQEHQYMAIQSASEHE